MAKTATPSTTDTSSSENGPARFKTSATAGPCPQQATHENTKVYQTRGSIRYCKCNDCGHTWKQSASEGDPFAGFLMQLADSLDTAARVDLEGGQKGIVLSDTDARSLTAQIRKFVTSS